MHKFLKLLPILFLTSIILPSCSKDDDVKVDCTDVTKNIVATWNVEMAFFGAPTTGKATFKSDGTLTTVPANFFGDGLVTYRFYDDAGEKQLEIVATDPIIGSKETTDISFTSSECNRILFGDISFKAYILLTK